MTKDEARVSSISTGGPDYVSETDRAVHHPLLQIGEGRRKWRKSNAGLRKATGESMRRGAEKGRRRSPLRSKFNLRSGAKFQ